MRLPLAVMCLLVSANAFAQPPRAEPTPREPSAPAPNEVESAPDAGPADEPGEPAVPTDGSAPDEPPLDGSELPDSAGAPVDGPDAGEPVDAEPADAESDPEADPEADPNSESGPAAELDPDADFGDYPEDDPASQPIQLRYSLERIDVRGEHRTRHEIIASYVPFEPGDVVDPQDPVLESIEWRLRGTGWFSQVDVRLERGRRRGWVVLVVDVVERNTVVIEQLTFGFSEGLNNTLDTSTDVLFYAGATVAETNLFGTGARLGLSGLGSARARGMRIDYDNPRLLPGSTFLRASFFYNNAREYFGNTPLVDVTCPEEVPECEPRNAVVFYKRAGLMLGSGRDLGSSSRFTLDWQGERISVRSLPDAASEDRGGIVRPIDFAIDPDISFVSALRFKLFFDRRDDPAMTTRGTYFRLDADLGQGLIGSDYDFLRLQAQFRQWVPLGGGHSLRFGAFVGAVFGEAPFFYKFHVSDFTDFVPGRYLEMQLDRRQAPNVFNTAIQVMRQQNLAARVDVQYEAPLFRGRRHLRALHGFINVGLLALGDARDLRVGFPSYTGLSGVPVDLTVDLGLRFDLSFGVFQVGFSNVLGFVQL